MITRRTCSMLRHLGPMATLLAVMAGMFGAAMFGAAGCAVGPASTGDRLLEDGDYGAALDAYRAASLAHPEDARVRRNLALAYFELADFDSASIHLRDVLTARPGDSIARYFYARALDEQGSHQAALEAYLASLESRGPDEKLVRARVRELSLQKAHREVRAAVAREQELKSQSTPENTIAVSDFSNVAERSDLEPLSRGLAAIVVSDLSKIEALRVLERERIQVLLDELGLAGMAAENSAPASISDNWHPLETTRGIQERLAIILRPGLGEAYFQGRSDGSITQAFRDAVRAFQADHGLSTDGIPGPKTQASIREELEATGVAPVAQSIRTAAESSLSGSARLVNANAPRLGSILGASRFVQGSFVPLGESDIQLDAALLETKTGRPMETGDPVIGPLPQVLRLEKVLVNQVLGVLGIEVTEAERRQLARLATSRYEAFLAFGRGLTHQEQGRLDDALQSYQEALRIDPNFEMAKEMEAHLTLTQEDESESDRAELLRAVSGSASTGERIVRTGSWIGVGPGPIVDRDGQLDPTVQPADKIIISTDADIVIVGDLPGRGAP